MTAQRGKNLDVLGLASINDPVISAPVKFVFLRLHKDPGEGYAIPPDAELIVLIDQPDSIRFEVVVSRPVHIGTNKVEADPLLIGGLSQLRRLGDGHCACE